MCQYNFIIENSQVKYVFKIWSLFHQKHSCISKSSTQSYKVNSEFGIKPYKKRFYDYVLRVNYIFKIIKVTDNIKLKILFERAIKNGTHYNQTDKN